MNEKVLKNILRRSFTEDQGSLCPNEIELAEYLEGTLNAERSEFVSEHAISCNSCFEKITEAEKTYSLYNEKEAERPPCHIEKRAKMVAKEAMRYGKIKNHFRRNKFFYLGITSLTFSFISKRYFAQFLAVAVILGFKWVMDTGGSKALIMIYDAWKTSRR